MNDARPGDGGAGARQPSARRRRAHEASTAQVMASARRLLAERGTAAGLSLSAVARDLDVVPSALYRYVGGRDQLLDALLEEAYDEIADTVEQAVALHADPVDGLVAAAVAWRDWSLRNTAEFALVFGPPVAGHLSRPGVEGAARRTGTAFAALAQELCRPGRAGPGLVPGPGPLTEELARVAAGLGVRADPAAGALLVSGWMRIQGHLTAEVFGHLPVEGAAARAELFGRLLHGLLIEAGVDAVRARGATASAAIGPARR